MPLIMRPNFGQLDLLPHSAPLIGTPPISTAPSPDPFDVCACCGERKAHVVTHHDHYRDVAIGIAHEFEEPIPDPATFPDATLCNDCNHLCPQFKMRNRKSPAFFSLTPADMRAFLARDSELYDRVEDRYLAAIKDFLAIIPHARAQMAAAWKVQQRPLPKAPIVKPERQIVLDTLQADAALKAAYDAKDVAICYRLATAYLDAGTWNRDALHSFSHLIWWTTHHGPKNSDVFSDAFKKGNLKRARRVFEAGIFNAYDDGFST
ncbi:hypothetical protein GC209_17990 [bacterium]|nr:hypothetical protein [bacterium]